MKAAPMHSDEMVMPTSFMSVLLDLTEGIHNDSQQKIEQHHEDQQLKGPEEEGCCYPLQTLQLVQVIIHTDIAQQNGKAATDSNARQAPMHPTAAHLDGVAKDEVCHHGIAHKHHATDKAEVDEVRACQGKGAGDNSQAGLEIRTRQHDSIQVSRTKSNVKAYLKLSKGSLELKELCEEQSPGSPEVDVKGQGIPQSKVPPNNDTRKEQSRRQEVYNVPG
ncbi:MAG: hypothetical protein FRX49_01937 [Trebouxia sp. A1-2]|nr:MAG: hypothetical protein FRX49_01937 [Trebouxia sp. A1-2]